MKRLIDSAILHIEPSKSAPEPDAIPIERLLEVADGLKEVIGGLADDKKLNEADDRQKAMPTQDVKDHYRLFVRPAQPGSYALPCELYDVRDGVENQPPLLNDVEISFFAVGNLINFANENDREGFFEVIQSPIVASKIMKGIEKIAPTEGESVSLEPSDQRNIAPIVIQPAAKAHVIEWSSLCEGPFEEEIVASISAIDLEANKVKLKVPGTTKKISADLDKELTSIPLGDVRDKKWKVLCDVTYHPNGSIMSIGTIKSIEELVLRELVFIDFPVRDKVIEFKTPLVVEEQLEQESGTLFVAKIPELYINVAAEFQAEVRELVEEELANKWSWIVECPDNDLSSLALQVKRRFLDMVKNTTGSVASHIEKVG